MGEIYDVDFHGGVGWGKRVTDETTWIWLFIDVLCLQVL